MYKHSEIDGAKLPGIGGGRWENNDEKLPGYGGGYSEERGI